MDATRNNMAHLIRILKTGDWDMLRRNPPCFVGVDHAEQDMEKLAQSQLAAVPKRRQVEDVAAA